MFEFLFFAGSEKADSSKLSIDQFLTTLRLIVVALATGLLIFAATIHYVVGPAGQVDQLFTGGGLVLGLAMLVLNPIVASAVQRQAIARLPVEEDAARGRLLMAYHTGRLVSCTMLEGAGFFNVIIYGFLSGNLLSLAMAGLLWMAILMKFPLRGVIEEWLERNLRASRDERALGGDD